MTLLTLGKLDALTGIIDRELHTCTSKCKQNSATSNISPENRNITSKPFGITSNGEQVNTYTLKNSSGMEVEILNYGGHIRSLRVPSSLQSKSIDVVIGLDTIQDYENQKTNAYFGNITGRFCNRICKGKFTLNNKEYNLAINNGPNTLHGGIEHFGRKIWNVTVLKDKIGVDLQYLSKDGEEGYPGNLDVHVEYTLNSDKNTLEIIYTATTDKSTIINLTNHSYFNLNGDFLTNSVVNNSHSFQLNCDYLVPINNVSMPLSSEFMDVTNTAFDFRKLSGDLIERLKNKNKDKQIINGGNGYAHNYVINGYKEETKQENLNECAVVIGNKSGIKLTVNTSEPGVQFYTANWLKGNSFGKGKIYDKRCSFCLEPQHFPDSPNMKRYPSVVLNPKETFKSMTQYCFS